MAGIIARCSGECQEVGCRGCTSGSNICRALHGDLDGRLISRRKGPPESGDLPAAGSCIYTRTRQLAASLRRSGRDEAESARPRRHGLGAKQRKRKALGLRREAELGGRFLRHRLITHARACLTLSHAQPRYHSAANHRLSHGEPNFGPDERSKTEASQKQVERNTKTAAETRRKSKKEGRKKKRKAECWRCSGRGEHSNARSTAAPINQLRVRLGLARWRCASAQTQPRSSPNAESELLQFVAEPRPQTGGSRWRMMRQSIAIAIASASDGHPASERASKERAKRVEAEEPTRKLQLRRHASQNDSSGSAASRRPHSIGQSAPAGLMQRKCSTNAEQKRAAPLQRSKSANPGGPKATTQQQQRFRCIWRRAVTAARHCTALHSLGWKFYYWGSALQLSVSLRAPIASPVIPRGERSVLFFFANAASRLRDIRPAFLQASCRAKSHAGPTRTSCCSSFEQSKAAATLASPPSHSRTAAASTTLSSHLACLACLRVALSHLDHHRRNLRASRVLSDSPPSTFSPAILCLALYHIDTISPSHPPPHPRPTDQMCASTTT
ncbi:hypothetical protein L1887_58672 [Cichorium endivia]|nr:hypothetical protein L1887_58672 [Cichorium endivia]